jgi:methylmalonyl-CoA mutase cobalamin-binding subunit
MRKSKQANSKSVVVTVTDAALKDIQSVAEKLRAKGMKVDQVLPVTGVISGSCPVSKQEALRSVKGVHSVEEDAPVQLAPPGSDVQ